MDRSQHVTRLPGPVVPSPALPTPPKPEQEEVGREKQARRSSRTSLAPWLVAGAAVFLIVLVIGTAIGIVLFRSRAQVAAAERATAERAAAAQAEQARLAELNDQLKAAQLQAEKLRQRIAAAEADAAKLRAELAAKPQPAPSKPPDPAPPPTPPPPVAPPAPAAIVYDFSDPKQLDDFQIETGLCEVKDGALVSAYDGPIELRLKRRLQGSFSVSWEQTSELSKDRPPSPTREVCAGVAVGGLRNVDDYYWASAWVNGGKPGPNGGASLFRNELELLGVGSIDGKLDIGSITDALTRVRGQPVRMGQTYRFQLDVDVEPGRTKVRLQGEGWKLENGRAFGFRPEYVRLRARGSRVKFDNLKITPRTGPAPAAAAPTPSVPPFGTEEDRRAAEWALGLKGFVDLELEGGGRPRIAAMANLPPASFRLIAVYLNKVRLPAEGLAPLRRLQHLKHLMVQDSPGFGDRALDAATLAEMPTLELLDLSSTAVTDAGLKQLRALTNLKQLDLGHTAVTDAGLAHLAALPRLERLDLTSTRISNAGLDKLHGMQSLQSLNVYKTSVTNAGVIRFAQAMPACRINR